MSQPRLHFRMVDDLGNVLVDEDVWIVDASGRPIDAQALAERHAALADRAAEAGRRTTMTATDPDGEIPAHVFITEPL